MITCVAVAVVAPARCAWAYVDPSAGSLMLQALLGGFAGLMVAFKLWHRRIWTWVRRRGRRGADSIVEPRR